MPAARRSATEATLPKLVGALLPRGQGQRFDGPFVLAANAQRRAAGGQDLKRRTGIEEGRGGRGHGRDEVLAVVEEEQELLAAEGGDEPVDEWPLAGLRHLEGAGNRGQHQGWIAQRGQIDEDDAVGERARHLVRDRQRQARLADAAGTGQGQQRHGFVDQQRAGGGHLTLPPDETGARQGQRCARRCQRLSHDVSTVTERR